MAKPTTLPLSQIFRDQPPEWLEINGQLYQPLFFIKTKGRDSLAHYVIHYVKDEKDIYYTICDPKNNILLLPLKSKNIDSFVAIDWNIGKDENRVYLRSKSKKVKNVAQFKLITEELQLYFDGENFYNQDLNPQAIDPQTFTLIPLTQSTKLKNWKAYNNHLKNAGLNELPLKSTMQYSHHYFLDKNHLYWHNNGWIRSLTTTEIREVLVDEVDVKTFIEGHPEVKKYKWYEL